MERLPPRAGVDGQPSEGARVVLVQKRRRQASDIDDHDASEVESRTRR